MSFLAFTMQEIIYLVILTLAIGYIFSGFIKKPDSARYYLRQGFNFEDLKFAIIVTAPAIILHELAHKFTAIAFGLTASFHIFWEGLGLAIFLKVIHSPFLIIAPGYVLIQQGATNIQNILISFAGPFSNLVLFLIAHLILTRAMRLSRIQAVGLILTKRINLLLFIFNMLPIPPLDGSHVLLGLIKLISSSSF